MSVNTAFSHTARSIYDSNTDSCSM